VCAIAGLYRAALPDAARLGCLKEMLARLQHRGPDETGYYIDGTMVMGTARLSIVDVRGGQQPIGDLQERYWIVFNGEIYNHRELRTELLTAGWRFRSQSDTEVLLIAWIAWGAAALERLNGAFAFCIFDREQRSAILGRDRFGKRPLYYAQQAGALLFGSEMKCFLAHAPFRFEFDAQQLASIFRIWTPVNEVSGFKGIRQVPPGACVYADEDSLKIVHHSLLELDPRPSQLSESHAAGAVREALSESVRLRLCDEVRGGVYLSGGIDSAIVALLVAQNTGTVPKTFSIGFEEEEFDETADQCLLASFLKTDHVSLRVGRGDIAAAFPEALWHAEVPVFRTAFVPMFLLSKLARTHGIKVVLTGEGADEAFLGYDIFKETLLRESWATLDLQSRDRGLARLYPYLNRFGGYGRAALRTLFSRFSHLNRSEFFSHDIRFHNSKLAGRLLVNGGDGLQPLERNAGAPHERYACLSTVQKAQWIDYRTLLYGYLLATQGDRMSLAHGVENRCPFLDPGVIRIACATNLRFSDVFAEKYLLKRAFAGCLPERILNKPKQPYRAPDASVFLRCRPDYLECIRSERELKKIDVLDTGFCLAFTESMFAKPPEAVSHAENGAFLLLLSVALLHEMFIARKSPPPPCMDSLIVTKIDRRRCA